MGVEGHVIAVIGASGGLGAPISRHLAERGAIVIAAARDQQRLGETNPGAATLTLDLRDCTAGDALVSFAAERFGRLDGVINAAGLVAFGSLADTDDVIIEELFLTNTLGPLWLLRRCLPLLEASKGFFANISAVVAEAPLPGMVAYSASKAALTAADSALTRELRRRGVRVVDIRPPHTETGLATRPISGTAPRLPSGLDPDRVASLIVDALDADDLPSELGSTSFDT